MSAAAYGGMGPGLLAEGWIFAGIGTILVAMRAYVRWKISPHGTWPLVWVTIAWTIAFIETICSTIAIYYGLGNDLTGVVEAGSLSKTLFWAWMTCFWFVLNTVMGKVAAASFLLAVHADAYPKRRYLLHFIIYSNIVVALPDMFRLWFHCNPPSALWNPYEQDKCDVTATIGYTRFLGAWSAASDIVMSILPVMLIWPLQMRLRLKLALCFLMGLGLVAAAASIMVAIYMNELHSTNITRDIMPLFFWGWATAWLVIISCSVPPVWPLVKRWAPSRSRSGSELPSDKQPRFIQLAGDYASSRGARSFGSNDAFNIGKHVYIEQHVEAAVADLDASYLGALDRPPRAYRSP